MYITSTINQFVVSKEKHFLSYQNEFLHSKPVIVSKIRVCVLICCLQDYLELQCAFKEHDFSLLFTNMKYLYLPLLWQRENSNDLNRNIAELKIYFVILFHY